MFDYWTYDGMYVTNMIAPGKTAKTCGIRYTIRHAGTSWSVRALNRDELPINERVLGSFDRLSDAEAAMRADAAREMGCNVSDLISTVFPNH